MNLVSKCWNTFRYK